MAPKSGNANLNINHPPPTFAETNPPPFTPRSSSHADDSETEYDPTPLHSPRGGPTYDDLPPSYEFAQQAAIDDHQNGITPLDPNQLEAHRLTINEGPDEAEVWEYRVRGEQPNASQDQERAPEYQNITDNYGTTVPVQHKSTSENIPVGHVSTRDPPLSTLPDHAAALLTRALEFTQHEPDGDVQYAPRLARSVAIPQIGRATRRGGSNEDEAVQFLRAYAKVLHAHSIRPAEFAEYLDGLNAVCVASGRTGRDLVFAQETSDTRVSLVQDYIRGANEAFFAPRGLRVSISSLSSLVESISIPVERGQRAGAIASALDQEIAPERRALALHPWAEALDTNVPEASARAHVLREMADRLSGNDSGSTRQEPTSQRSNHSMQEDDPPHSIPESLTEPHAHDAHDQRHHRHHRGGRGHRGGPWTPLGPPGRGPSGVPGHGPSGAPGHGPWGGPGCGPFGRGGHGSFAGRGRRGGHHASRSVGHPNNDWAALGRDFGKMGEQLGKRMEEWGVQFGRQAEAWGRDVERSTANWGDAVNARASGSGTRGAPVISQTHGEPLSYQDISPGQESGVLRGDSKLSISVSKSGKDDKKSLDKSSEKKFDKNVTKSGKHGDNDEDDSSDSDSEWDSDSDSDSDSDGDEIPDTEAVFLKRIRSINKQAEAAEKKGKKSSREVAQERDSAIEAAQLEKDKMDHKIELKSERRQVKRDLQRRRKELMHEHRSRKREMKVAHGASGKGKGKGKASNTPEWKAAKKEYREKRKVLKKEKKAAFREWKEIRADGGKERKQMKSAPVDIGKDSESVWMVIENLGP